MHTFVSHVWDVSPQEAVQNQEHRRDRVVQRNYFGSLQTITGADVSDKPADGNARAAIVVLFSSGTG
jgi:deoxyinosine 3'endonuclease (endonuclease V)